MKISKISGLGSYGHYIDGVDFKTLSDEEWMEIGQQHMKGLVTILRNVNLTPNEYREWMLKFGPFKSNYRHTLKTIYGKDVRDLTPEDIEKIDNDFHKYLLTQGDILFEKAPVMGVQYASDLGWHSNESGVLTFCPGIALLGDKFMIGSSTGFVQTADYYESLSESFRSELDEMVVVHKFTPGMFTEIELENEFVKNIMQIGFCPFDGSEIPLVMQSPGGIRGLHFSFNTVSSIKGMSDEESAKLIKELNKGIFTDEYVFDHWYQQDNDLLLFDNSITMHRRLGGTGDRLLHRIQFDYSNLLDTSWDPYFLPEFVEKYRKEIYEVLATLDEPEFKLPTL